MRGTESKCFFWFSGAVQLVHAHTDEPLIRCVPRIRTSCSAQITQKENGIFVFVNAAEETFQVRVEPAGFLPETVTVKGGYGTRPQIVRCSPDPKFILEEPSAGTTYFYGTDEKDELVFLICPLEYCTIKRAEILPDGRVLFESGNFSGAGTGRWLRLQTDGGEFILVRTALDTAYDTGRYFVTESAVNRTDIKLAEPVFCARADSEGNFVISVNYAKDGVCSLLGADGEVRRSIQYKAGGRVML